MRIDDDGEKRSPQDILADLTAADITPNGVRRLLEAERAGLNVRLWEAATEYRLAWIGRVQGWLHLACLALLLILLGPVYVWRTRPEGTRRSDAVRSIPYFAMTTAMLFVLMEVLIDLVVGVEQVQLALATLGSPAIAATDAAIHYLVFVDDADVAAFTELLHHSRSRALEDPFGAFGLLQHLFDGLRALKDSPLLTGAWHLAHSVTWIMELYGPLIGVAVVILMWSVLSPLVRHQITYPIRVLDGEESPSLWRYAWSQFKVVWRELRAVIWMMLLIVLLTISAVVVVRLLAFPMAVVTIKTLLACELILREGGDLPDLALLLSFTSLGIYMLVCSALIIGPMAVALGKTYTVVRHRIAHKKRWRDYPLYRGQLRRAFRDVAGMAILAAVSVATLYAAAIAVFESPNLRIWLPTLLFGVLFVAAIRRSVAFGRLLTLAREDPLVRHQVAAAIAQQPLENATA